MDAPPELRLDLATRGRALVVGGGVGGLASATALRLAGYDVTLLERGPSGAGDDTALLLRPAAVTALRRLGFGEQLDVIAAPAVDLTRSGSGGWPPPLACRRGALRAVLRAALEPGVVRSGPGCVGVGSGAEDASVSLADGTTARGDVVVGADGFRSTVRFALLGGEPPRLSGLTAWRALFRYHPSVARFLEPGEWRDGARLFGLVRLPGSRAGWYAYARTSEAPGGSPADEKGSVWRLFGGRHGAIAEALDATPDDAVVRTDLWETSRAPRAPAGRVALVGDAVGVALPRLECGAGRAIEDAVALADALSATARVEEALAAYSRRPRGRAQAPRAAAARAWPRYSRVTEALARRSAA